MPDVLEQCKVRDATLVGFSMGSGEVARYLSRHSGKGVVSAALVSSVVPFMLKTDDNSNGIEVRGDDRGDEGGPGKVLHELLQGLFRSRPDLSSDQRRTGASNVDSGMQAGLKPTLACAKAFATTDFRPELHRFGAQHSSSTARPTRRCRSTPPTVWTNSPSAAPPTAPDSSPVRSRCTRRLMGTANQNLLDGGAGLEALAAGGTLDLFEHKPGARRGARCPRPQGGRA